VFGQTPENPHACHRRNDQQDEMKHEEGEDKEEEKEDRLRTYQNTSNQCWFESTTEVLFRRYQCKQWIRDYFDGLETNQHTPLTTAVQECFRLRLQNPNNRRTIEIIQDQLMDVFYHNYYRPHGRQEHGSLFFGTLFYEALTLFRTTMQRRFATIWKNFVGHRKHTTGICPECGYQWDVKVLQFDTEITERLFDKVWYKCKLYFLQITKRTMRNSELCILSNR